MIWLTIVAAAVGCYLLKLVGLSLPESTLQDRRVQRVAAFLPVALLTALAVTQTFSEAHRLVLDQRAAGLAVGLVTVLLRAPFLVVVLATVSTTVVLRAL